MSRKNILQLPMLECIRLKLRCFIKHVPGFRSGKKINMIIASTYYIINLLWLIISLIVGKNDLRAPGFSLLFPFLIFGSVDQMNKTFQD